MVLRITQGFDRRCKDNLGGVRKLYLFPFVKYLRSQIITIGEELTSFPTTTIFEFETNVISFNEPMQENEGGKFYNQNLEFSLIGTDDLKIGYKFQYFNGQTGLARIYNRILTAQEVAQNFNAQRQRFGI
jgi:hypothetical protein